MSFFVSRSVSPAPSPDRADIFARGDVAVLAMGTESTLVQARGATLDPSFELIDLGPWGQLGDEGSVVVLAPNALVYRLRRASLWLIDPERATRLEGEGNRSVLASRLVLVSASIASELAEETIIGIARHERYGRVAAALTEASPGAVLVAER